MNEQEKYNDECSEQEGYDYLNNLLLPEPKFIDEREVNRLKDKMKELADELETAINSRENFRQRNKELEAENVELKKALQLFDLITNNPNNIKTILLGLEG